ncbi:MAG: NAD(+) synthase [Rikenellaceae bacterium]|nr:NAD(+) synthase [Rikenellaceae bacterium]
MNSNKNPKVATAVAVVRVADPLTNSKRIITLIEDAAQEGAQIVVTPELSITGASCGDLICQRPLLRAALRALDQVAAATQKFGVTVVVGMPMVVGDVLCNVAVVASEGRILRVVPKCGLSSDERRWFSNAVAKQVEIGGHTVEVGTHPIALSNTMLTVAVGDDVWSTTSSSLILNPYAEPATMGSYARRRRRLMELSSRCANVCVAVGAGFGESSTDVAWSSDMTFVSGGNILAEGERFATQGTLTCADIHLQNIQSQPITASNPSQECDPHPFIPKSASESAEAFMIQRSGLMQRLASCGIRKCVIGISGGLDSTLALLVTVAAYDALNLCRRDIVGITMPGFGTTSRTHTNAVALMRSLGITTDEISIRAACEQHFCDIGLPADDRSATYENAQARERTQILMDYAGRIGGIVVGTGDLSELALGWATYNGDHMSMYGVNAGVPKTMVKHLVEWYAESVAEGEAADILRDIVDTPISPELLPADESGNIAQQTEDLVGPYELHDFFIYNMLERKLSPSEIYAAAVRTFEGKYDGATIKHWLTTFVRRFFTQQFKRSAVPDGVKVCNISLSPRSDWRMPSDASSAAWLADLEDL